ncbi:MAG TPA: ribosome maturation factor RimM [Agriterribacter sp.]|nr:ribosome maturation factor RimM [Agriterribacter sp.]
MAEYFKIGKIVAAFGLEGEVILMHSLGKKSALKGIEAIFIEDRKASFLPYFVQSVRVKNEKESYLKMEDISSREGAQMLVQKEVWMEEKDFKRFSAQSAPIALLGFTMIGDAGVELGIIEEVIEQPHQVLCKIVLSGGEILIPLHEETLKGIDKKKKQVFVELPEGLLEIYKKD